MVFSLAVGIDFNKHFGLGIPELLILICLVFYFDSAYRQLQKLALEHTCIAFAVAAKVRRALTFEVSIFYHTFPSSAWSSGARRNFSLACNSSPTS
jgi:hypothetical protein